MGIRTAGLDVEVTGFTPVRRRLSTISKIQNHDRPEKEWTATRCNRLLRALKSRVAVLRREISHFEPALQSRDKLAEFKNGGTLRQHRDNRKQGRIKQTYSRKTGIASNDRGRASPKAQSLPSLKEAKRLIPGEVSVPTPILTRAWGEVPKTLSGTRDFLMQDLDDRETRKRPRMKDEDQNFQLSGKMREIRSKFPASQSNTYEGIFHATEALLKATASEEPPGKRKGSRSLFTMCLDNIPHYISQEETLLTIRLEETREKSAINSRDISTEIYDDLEAFGSSRNGWKHLRKVVRSHGIQVICDGIGEGLLDIEFCEMLVTLCIEKGAPREAEALLTSLLCIDRLPGPKSIFSRFCDNVATRPLLMLRNYADQVNVSFEFRQLSTMISKEILPLSWLATREFAPIWASVFQALSSKSTYVAAGFLGAAISMLAMQSDKIDNKVHPPLDLVPDFYGGMKQTFSSLLTTLVSIVILSKETEDRAQSQDFHYSPPNYEHVQSLLQGCLLQMNLSHGRSIQQTLLLLADVIIKSLGNGRALSKSPKFNVDITLKHSSQHGELASVNDLAAFVCSVAQCCGRGTSTSGFSHLKQLHCLLGEVKKEPGERILHGVIVDSAFLFAQHAPNRRHLDYAFQVEAKHHVMNKNAAKNTMTGSTSDRVRMGFRWEEGISEWVTATPSLSIKKRCKVEPIHPRDESDHHKSIQSRFRRRLDIGTTTLQGSTQSLEAPIPQNSSNKISRRSPECHSLMSDNSDDGGNERDSRGPSSYSGSLPTSPISSMSFISNYDSTTSAVQSGEAVADESSAFTRIRGHRYVDRAPRLNRRVLQRSFPYDWQLFDDSDDELSFCSASSHGDRALRDVTGGKGSNNERLRRKQRSVKRQKQSVDLSMTDLVDSEDELCI